MSLPAAKENRALLKKIEDALRRKKIMSPAVEAEILVRHFSKMSRVELFTGQKAVSSFQKKQIIQALQKRLSGIPSAYVTGIAGFYGHDFHVNPSVLIPRPETELLVEETLRVLPAKNPQILEIGAGSGCVAVSLTIARPDCRMTALEVSPEALKTARKNARFHGVQRRLSLFRSDLFEIFGPKDRSRWDTVVSNPPYVPRRDFRRLQREVKKEPRLALDGGPQGLDLLEAILQKAPAYLKPGGFILLEIGKGQSQALTKIATTLKCYKNLKFVKDYSGIERISIMQVK